MRTNCNHKNRTTSCYRSCRVRWFTVRCVVYFFWCGTCRKNLKRETSCVRTDENNFSTHYVVCFRAQKTVWLVCFDFFSLFSRLAQLLERQRYFCPRTSPQNAFSLLEGSTINDRVCESRLKTLPRSSADVLRMGSSAGSRGLHDESSLNFLELFRARGVWVRKKHSPTRRPSATLNSFKGYLTSRNVDQGLKLNLKEHNHTKLKYF